MTKFLVSMAHARDSVDRSIAYGEAAAWVGRARTVALVALAAVVVLLAIGYLNLLERADRVDRHLAAVEKLAQETKATQIEIVALVERNQKSIERLTGQRGANAPR